MSKIVIPVLVILSSSQIFVDIYCLVKMVFPNKMNNKNLVNGCIRYPRKMKILFWLSVFCAFACVSCLLYFCEFFLVCVYLPNKMNE